MHTAVEVRADGRYAVKVAGHTSVLNDEELTTLMRQMKLARFRNLGLKAVVPQVDEPLRVEAPKLKAN